MAINGKVIKGYSEKDTLQNDDGFLFQRGNKYFYVNASKLLSGATVSDTYANVNTLLSAGTLAKGALYYLTDKYIFVVALDVDKIQQDAVFLARNADFQSVGDYTGITIANGFTVNGTGTNLGLWTDALAPASGDVVIWDNLHWLNITGANGGNDPSADAVNWESVSNTDITTAFDYGYIEETDPLQYDFVNDTIRRRVDKRGNDINGQTGINNWRWGDDLVTDNVLTKGSYFAIENNFGTISDNKLTCKINENSLDIISGVTMSGNILNVGGVKMILAYDLTNSTFTGWDAMGIYPREATNLINVTAGAGSDWSTSLELTATAYNGATAYNFGDYAQSGTRSYMNINPNGSTGSAPGGADWVLVFDTVLGAGRHILNIERYHNAYGTLNMSSTNATETIDEMIWGDGLVLKQQFECDTALTATFAVTAIASLANDGEIIGTTNRVVQGAQHEFAIFEQYDIGGTDYTRWVYGRTDYV